MRNNNSGSIISVHAGFPNAAADTTLHTLDLNQLLIANPSSTFFMRITGNEWQNIGILNNDIAIVDRALNPRKNDLIVWCHDDRFAISFTSAIPSEATCWGVVSAIVHCYRNSES